MPIKVMIAIIAIFLCSNYTIAQEKFTISGYVRDQANGEELIGATILVKELGLGTVSNPYGFYSLTLPRGEYILEFNFIGYDKIDKSIVLYHNIEMNLELPASNIITDEVIIEGTKEDLNVTDVSMSKVEMNIDQVKKLPALFGEVDIIKTVQMMPGVVSAGEGTSSYFVRGGSSDQNLILIDEAPIYDPSHMFGLFSVFNADVIKSSDLYKGGIPVEYGGRLSSILDIRSIDGNNREMGVNGGVGLLASRIMIEAPIQKEKSSFLIAGRRSYADLFLKLSNNKDLRDDQVYFYDINAKVNFRANNNNRFFISVYNGRDALKFGNDFGFDWGNRTATIRWNHLYNKRLFSNTSLIGSIFDYGLESNGDALGLEWTSNISELSLKNDFNYFLNTNNTIDFGYQVSWKRFSPGKIVPEDETSIFNKVELERMYALDHAFYAGNEQRISSRISMSYGIRLSIFQNMGKTRIYEYADQSDNISSRQDNILDTIDYDHWENIVTYINPEPRFSIRYLLNESNSIKGSYNRMVQNAHIISSGTVPLPFNTWNPSSPYLKPQIADQIALGYFKNINSNMYELSGEIFYKNIQNVTDFADNAEIFFNFHLANEFRQGNSEAYGLELFARKNKGKLTGFASYTLSKATRTIEGVNNGKTFNANYDRRHNFNIIATYALKERIDIGANFTYSSGRPISIPSGKYEYLNYTVQQYTARNAYKLPAYHRLDLSLTLNGKKYNKKGEARKMTDAWVFSIYNVYNRQNAFTIYTETKTDEDGNVLGDGRELVAKKVSLFGILPSVTYNFRF
ncbi:MAG: TonB-dependent receptor [Cytophagales bacterium]